MMLQQSLTTSRRALPYATRSTRRHVSLSSTSTAAGADDQSSDDDNSPLDTVYVEDEVIRGRLQELINLMDRVKPSVPKNFVYELNHWIDYPVQVMVSDVHNPNGEYYMSTRSIGEFILNIMNANMSVKTNITTTIVRKFKAHDPDTFNYGLLVKTIGQKPEKKYQVQMIPKQQGHSAGRGSHTNSRGTSYYWPIDRIPYIVNQLINTIHKSKAFRDITFLHDQVVPVAGHIPPEQPTTTAKYDLLHVMAYHADNCENIPVTTDGSSVAEEDSGPELMEESTQDPNAAPPTMSNEQRIQELRQCIVEKKKKIEFYNNSIVGLIFDVAQDEQALRQLQLETAAMMTH